ncbi:hypothetical protein HJFPF1_09073 [Paramyrothecium foliicola]|nr:hypothetical protein HJFPF1_09073 [Paramyrothecium foliicola]
MDLVILERGGGETEARRMTDARNSSSSWPPAHRPEAWRIQTAVAGRFPRTQLTMSPPLP